MAAYGHHAQLIKDRQIPRADLFVYVLLQILVGFAVTSE